MRLLLALAALGAASSPAAAQACTVSADFVAPSTYEMVQRADAIVIARPRPRPGPDRAEGDGAFLALPFRVERALKGTPPRTVEVMWASIGAGSGIGMCARTGFEAGRRYILSLVREEDGQYGRFGNLAADAVDYDGENGPWMRTVRRYLAIQQSLALMDQLAALRLMAETGRDQQGRVLAPEEREDVNRHLRSISPWKPTPWLLDLYQRLERGEPLPLAAPPPSEAGEPADDIPTVRRRILLALALGDHPDALPLFERLLAAPQPAAGARGPVLRYLANHGRYESAYGWIETQLMAELARLPERQARTLLRDVFEVQGRDSSDREDARWRSDPRAAASWPELALSLFWYQTHSVDSDERETDGLADAIRAIAVSDRRARPDVTAALGALFDPATRDWAIAELAAPQTSRTARAEDDGDRHPARRYSDHPDLLPLRVVASAWTHGDREVLMRAFCAGGDRRRLTIQALGQWGDDLYESLLSHFAAAPDLSAEDFSLLRRAAILMDAREIGDWGTADVSTSRGEERLVGLLGRGERPAGPDPCRAGASAGGGR